MNLKSVLLTVAALLAAAPAIALTEHEQDVAAWRAGRIERLTGPTGWLSLVGLHWLVTGQTVTLGNGKDNDINLGVGPARLGRIDWKDTTATLTIAEGVTATVEAVAAVAPVELAPDSSGAPTIVSFGSANLQLLARGDKFALRVKDAQAATRTNFAGIPYYDVAADWRIEARFETYPEPREIEVATVTGTLEKYPNPGRIVFERDGKTYSLEALIEEGEDQYFLIMADRTSGKETYGMARYLYAGPPVDGKIVVDFNKAYNPPCAFTAYATCPMPPEGNRLDLYVRAGEKKYQAAAH
jgi:uncharacterized protein (DUF1684 family)